MQEPPGLVCLSCLHTPPGIIPVRLGAGAAATSLEIVADRSRWLVTVRCGGARCRHVLARVVALDDGRVGILISEDAADGAQWLVDSGRCRRRGPSFVLPDDGLVPIAPCPRHTQWSGGPGQIRRASARNLEHLAERTGSSITVMRTAYIDVARIAKPLDFMRRTGRTTTLLVAPADYNAAEQLEPRRDLWQKSPG